LSKLNAYQNKYINYTAFSNSSVQKSVDKIAALLTSMFPLIKCYLQGNLIHY